MLRFQGQFAATTLLTFFASTSFAEVSADDVWADLQTYVSSVGYVATGTPERDGNRLLVTGVTLTQPPSDAEMRGSVDIGRLVLTETSDGTVQIEFPKVMPMTLASPEGAGDPLRISLDYRQNGMSIVASGTPEALTYAYAAEDISIVSTGFEVDGQILPPGENAFEVVFEDLSGTTDVIRDDRLSYNQKVRVEAVRYTVTTGDGSGLQQVDLTGQLQGMTFAGQNSLPRDIQTDDINVMLEAGLTVSGTFSTQANAATLTVQGQTGVSDATLLSGPGELAVAIEEGGAVYDLRQSDIRTEVKSARIALPLSFAIDEATLNMKTPLRSTTAAQDFAAGLDLNGMRFPEALWALLDPGSQLPRDAMSVALELAGKARLMFDILDPAQAMDIEANEVPAEIESIDIKQIRIDAVGAELNGAGAIKFNETNTGIPQPEGAVDFQLVGGNGLIDNLIASGLLPEQQAMGVRMMLALLATPGDRPDTLNSRIEINDQGHVLANGQRIR